MRKPAAAAPEPLPDLIIEASRTPDGWRIDARNPRDTGPGQKMAATRTDRIGRALEQIAGHVSQQKAKPT